MSETELRERLVDSGVRVREALAQLEGAMEDRSGAVKEALDRGWEPEVIAEAADLTVGQVWNAGRGDPISPPPLGNSNRGPG